MRDVVFSVTTEVSSVPVRGNALAVSAEQDRRAEDAIIARVDAGDVCAWCTITVTAEFEGLSGVSVCGPFTTTERRFLKSADFREMKRGAFGALRAGVSERNAAALSWGRTFDRWHDESRRASRLASLLRKAWRMRSARRPNALCVLLRPT